MSFHECCKLLLLQYLGARGRLRDFHFVEILGYSSIKCRNANICLSYTSQRNFRFITNMQLSYGVSQCRKNIVISGLHFASSDIELYTFEYLLNIALLLSKVQLLVSISIPSDEELLFFQSLTIFLIFNKHLCKCLNKKQRFQKAERSFSKGKEIQR